MDLAAAAFYFVPFLSSKITCKGNIYNSYMQTFFHFFYTFCDFLYVFLCFLMKIAFLVGSFCNFLSPPHFSRPSRPSRLSSPSSPQTKTNDLPNGKSFILLPN